MDIRDLSFEPESFDIALDKGATYSTGQYIPSLMCTPGTMDAMMTAKGSVWDPPAQVVEDCTREIDEVIRSDHFSLCLLVDCERLILTTSSGFSGNQLARSYTSPSGSLTSADDS